MNGPYSIREADTSDIDLIRKLCEQIWPDTYAHLLSQEQLDYMMDWMYSPESLQTQMKEGCHFLLLLHQTQAIGYASYQSLGQGRYKLHKLYVLPGFQGKGGGKCMVAHIILQVQGHGGQTIELQVNRKNKARFFYEALGFTIREEADIEVGPGFFMNDYIMQLQVCK